MSKNKKRKSKNTIPQTPNRPIFSTLVEGAFVVMVGQNALMISKPIVSIFTNKISIIEFLFLIAIGIVNTINIVFIWISSKQNADNYSAKYFVWDVITLVLLFALTQVCIDAFKDQIFLLNINNIVLIFSIAYIIIYLGYIFWNLEEIYLNDIRGKEKRKIIFLNIYIGFYIVSLIVLLVSSIINNHHFMNISFLISIIITGFIFTIFCKNYVN